MARSVRSLRSALVTSTALLVALVVTAVGLVMALLDQELSAVVIISGIGLNLAASAVFALVFSLTMGNQQEQALVENLQDESERLRADLLQSIRMLGPTFLPSAMYPPIDLHGGDFGIRFNLDLMRSFNTASTIVGRLQTAWYLAPRLSVAQHGPQSVKLLILDPRDPSAIERRVADWHLGQPVTKEIRQARTAQFRNDVAASLVLLFDQRHVCPIDILPEGDSSIFRYEVYDDAVYLSWFHAPDSAGRDFPASYRFPRGSFLWQTFHMEVNRRFEMSKKIIRFRATDEDDKLVEHLREVTGLEVDAERLQQIRTQNEQALEPYVTFLRKIQREA